MTRKALVLLYAITTATSRRYGYSRRLSSLGPRSYIRSLHELRLRLAAFHAIDKLFWIKIHTKRILCKRLSIHVRRSVVGINEVVHLRLDLIAVRIGIIHTCCHTVVDAPGRMNAESLPLQIRDTELGQIVVGEGDVCQADRVCCVTISVQCPWTACDGNAVVLIVISYEADGFIAPDNMAAQERDIPVDHGLVLLGFGSQDHVAQAFRWYYWPF